MKKIFDDCGKNFIFIDKIYMEYRNVVKIKIDSENLQQLYHYAAKGSALFDMGDYATLLAVKAIQKVAFFLSYFDRLGVFDVDRYTDAKIALGSANFMLRHCIVNSHNNVVFHSILHDFVFELLSTLHNDFSHYFTNRIY